MSQNRKRSSQGRTILASLNGKDFETKESQNRKRSSQGRARGKRTQGVMRREFVTKPQAVITRSSVKEASKTAQNNLSVTKPQAVITRSSVANPRRQVPLGYGRKTASGHHKVEGRPENPHYRRLKKAFLKNKQTFFCRINKIRLHTMT